MTYFINIVQTAIIVLALAFTLNIFFLDAFSIPSESMENNLQKGDYVIAEKFLVGPSTPKYIPFTEIKIPSFKFPSLVSPERGDVIVFESSGKPGTYPNEKSVDYVKRVIALPGDTIEIVDKKVYVNGVFFEEPEGVKFNNQLSMKKGKPEDGIFPSGIDWNKDNYGPFIIPRKGTEVDLDVTNIQIWKPMIDYEFGKNAAEIKGRHIEIDGFIRNKYKFENNYYFVLGDNRDNSSDSRYLGPIPEDKIVGQVRLVYWSVDISKKLTEYLITFRL